MTPAEMHACPSEVPVGSTPNCEQWRCAGWVRWREGRERDRRPLNLLQILCLLGREKVMKSCDKNDLEGETAETGVSLHLKDHPQEGRG